MTTVMPNRTLATRPAPPRGLPPAGPTATTMRVDPFRVLRRHLWTIVGSVMIGCALGVVAYFLLARFYPLYSGTTYFEIRANLTDPTQTIAADLTQDELVERLARTESVLLRSRTILSLAVQHADVRGTDWFKNNFIDKNGTPQYDDAVDELEEDVAASPVRGSNLFVVKWSTHHAADVPIVLGQITKTYLAQRKKQDDQILDISRKAFDGQLTNSNTALSDLGMEIQSFIRDKGISTLEDPRFSQTALYAAQLTQDMTRNDQQLQYSKTALQQVSAKLQGRIEPDFLDRQQAEQDPLIIALDQQVNQARAALSVTRAQYQIQHSEDHIEIRKAESRLRSFESTRDARLEEILTRNLEARRAELTSEIARYESVLVQLGNEADSIAVKMKELAAVQSEYNGKELRREFLEASRDKQLSLLNEVDLMKLREDAKRVRVVEEAFEPRALSFPKPEVIVPLGGLLLLGLTVGVIFLRELTDQRVKTASDLTVLPHSTVLGVIPELSEDPTGCPEAELVVRRCPNSVLAESYRQTYAPIVRLMDRAGHQAIVMTGGLPGSGTTTAVTNLAAAAAAAGRRVVVIDANFRRPRLARLLGAEDAAPGLGDLLVGEADLLGVIHENEDRISVISAGTPKNRVFERLNNGRFDQLVAELRDQFDMVIFDAPPAVVAGDAIVLANRVDAAVLVVRANQEQRGLVARLLSQFSQAQADFLGMVLNRPRGTAGGYFRKNFAAMAAYSKNGE